MAMSLSLGGTSLTTVSPMVICPSVISSRPATILRVVDLPQPEGPTSTINSLSLMSKLMLSTAVTLPKRFVTFFRRTCANEKSPLRQKVGYFKYAGVRSPDILTYNEIITHNVLFGKTNLEIFPPLVSTKFRTRFGAASQRREPEQTS